MASREDLRVTKTKAALTHAFFEMLTESDVDDITVNDLCERAEIRRATFYKHFSDKVDFLCYLIRDIRDNFDKQSFRNSGTSITVDYYVEYIAAIGNFLSERETAIAKILRSPLRATFIHVVMQQNYIDTKEKLEQSVRDGMTLPASVPVVANMLIGGVSHNILRWFELEERPPISDLIEEVVKLIEAILK